MVIGFALLVGIEFLAQNGSVPKYEPAATTPVAGAEETPAQPRNPDRRVEYDALAKRAGGTPEQKVAEATPNPVIELKRVEPIAILKREAPQPILELQRTPPSNPVPAAEEFHEPVSLPNGADLVPPANSEGLGILKISNYTGHDAAVKLKTLIGRATVRFVYVRAKSDGTISRSPPESMSCNSQPAGTGTQTALGFGRTGHSMRLIRRFRFRRDRSRTGRCIPSTRSLCMPCRTATSEREPFRLKSSLTIGVLAAGGVEIVPIMDTHI